MAVTLVVCLASSTGVANEHEPEEGLYLYQVSPDVRSSNTERLEQLLPGTGKAKENQLASSEILPTLTPTIRIEPTLTPTHTPSPTNTIEPTQIPTNTPEPTFTPTSEPTVQVQITPDGTEQTDAWEQFLEGYREAGGNPALEQIFICVGSHEGSQWLGYYGENGYWSRFQFSNGDTWPKVSAYIESLGIVPNPDVPYIIGLMVGWWSQQTDPSGIGGWYHTWRLCT